MWRVRVSVLPRLSRSVSDIQASRVSVTPTKHPKPLIDLDLLEFGKYFTDHMLEVDYEKDKGWGTPYIKEYQSLRLDPSCSVFHYGIECFEGLKAYLDKDGHARLFRPDMNMERMNTSCKRLALPSFDGKEVQKLIQQLVLLDKRWIPKRDGFSLYIRPTMIATQDALGVAPSDKAKLFVILSPAGPYFKQGFKPVKLLADEHNRRAFEGGIGFTKAGGNYAPTIKPLVDAKSKKYDQVLWLAGSGKKAFITEVGTMNMFTLWINEKGEKELITAPLDGTILPGVTRDSILTLAREWKEFKVTEAPHTIDQFCKAADEGRLIEAFGAGTACIVSPIYAVKYKEKEYAVPLHPTEKGKPGVYSQRFTDVLLDIQYGRKPHKWSVVLD